jgi:DNA-binding CsgD family transcriptional regulator
MVAVENGMLLGVVDRIYESIDKPQLWPGTIDAIGGLLGGRRHFWVADDPDHSGSSRTRPALEAGCQPVLLLSQADLKALDDYEREFGELIVRFLTNIFLSILCSPNEAGAREAIGASIAQRYLHAIEPLDHTSACPQAGSQRRKLLAALWEDGHAFRHEHLVLMRSLTPHLDRAIRLQLRLRSSNLYADSVSSAFDALTLGVILVDCCGRVLWTNKRAREMTGGSGGLRICDSQLCAPLRSETQSLRRLIEEAVSTQRSRLSAIKRGPGLRPLLVMAFPLASPNGEAADRTACGAVFLTDPDRADRPSVDSLQRIFDLTYREAQAAIAIANGHGLKAAARAMGVAPTTVRSQLQQAFAKTGTKHQAELAALIHKTLTQVRND